MKSPTREFYREWPYPGRFVDKMRFWSRFPEPIAQLGYNYWAAKLLRRRRCRKVFEGIVELLATKYECPLRVLDAGCGTGEESFRLAAAFPGRVRIDAFDLSDQSLDAAKLTHQRIRHLPGVDQIRFRKGDVLDPVEGKYHLILSNGVLHHTGNTELGLRQLAQALFPGGMIYLYLYGKYGWLEEDAQRQALLQLAQLGGKRLDQMLDFAIDVRIGSTGRRWKGKEPLKSRSWFDCFMNPHVDRFSIREVFELLERCALEFHSFHPVHSLEPASLGVSAQVVARLTKLPRLEMYSILEKIFLPGSHELFARKSQQN